MGQKRDRWASSSDEDDEGDKKQRNKPSKSQNSKSSKKIDEKSSKASPPLPPLHNPLLLGCRSVYDTYEQISRVSEGTYGIVWKARDLRTNNTVALKQIKFDVDQKKEGFPVIALREINILMALSSHESIVSVKEMVVGDAMTKVFMVMDFYEFDLKVGIDRFEGALLQSELKGIMQQILAGMAHMHNAWYLHRDMKTSNILVHSSGRIALADFGLARQYSDPPRELTQLVCTLWYRAPELLFGESKYGPAVDMWSIGCIFGELIRKDAVLKGEGELDQIDQIFSLVGTATEDNWPSFKELPNAGLFRWKPAKKEDTLLPKKFPIASPVSANQAFLDQNGYNLLEHLFTLDPSSRISAQQALDHPYLCEGVPPKAPRFFSSS
mmetsp:Transcript_1583/g.2253  ORF Transcript_1583/g.2253 Transcript_1583/m.2253 type:complete len:382 (+) Transcript_1583:238-1383(+)|eukprot:CAMPEP_0198145020 /NCGR_PEP_ID=MMETSP1443-20131203/20391_1 /TAXON_ID=186043 /ORGANISM="Entomoneis sp., Strain CCMP2396" /LENGTH=381 /DNA_ID=CAMNT_0043808531 /DNA_START=167 /DNA_END=1312 /DNA_ORIENTATION=-